ncbi:MAG: exonuclease domain-containing protein [Trichloromonas sp.]|jgi:DNA polymerase-3 subunit epsilon|nr:exonuclease domain-containing protein [Trichloromonas sp.]
MKPQHRYWLFLVTIAIVIFGVIWAALFGSWLCLAPNEQAYIKGLFEKILPFPMLGSVILVTAIGGLVSMLFYYYVIPLLQLAEKTRLMATANPDYRIFPRGAGEVVYLTGIINDYADAFQKLKTEVDARIQEAQAQIDEERNRLAALMSELPNGVLVCNTDGLILLYNQQAQTLLHPENGQNPAGIIGLGRPVFDLLQREPILHAFERLRQAVRRDLALSTLGFMMTRPNGECLRLNMALVLGERDDEPEISGFVLTLEDMTPQIEADNRRDRLLQTMTDTFQDGVADIRRAISTILTRPKLKPHHLERYRRVIDRASLTLQQNLVQIREHYAQHRHALSKVEDILAENLLEILSKTLYDRFGAELQGEAQSGLWLRLDSYSLVQALSHLAALLKGQKLFGAFQISLRQTSRESASMTIGWPDYSLDYRFIADWVATPVIVESQDRSLSFSELVSNFGGAVFIESAGDKACYEIRIELPLASLGAHEDESPSPHKPRPVYYEFDLFNRPGMDDLGKRPLRKLTYVVFDTETTGLNPSQGDEIIQLGAIRIVNGRLLHDEIIDQLVDPGRNVPPESVAIHGIDPARLIGQPTIDQVLPHFHKFTEGAVLVAHNAAFDMRFLQLKEHLTGLRFANPVLDTLLLSSVVSPNQPDHSVDAIAEMLNLAIHSRHTALGDAIVTAEVLLKLIPLLEAHNIFTLEDALKASAHSPFAKMAY